MGAEDAVNQAFASIKPVPYGSSPFAAVNKNQFRMLYFLFNKNLEKALRILDNRGVTRITANPSGRVVFQVTAESKGLGQYVCFPDHFCSCPAYHFEVVSRGQQLCCKHQLAARLANSLNICKE
ncbi:unnamed protein product [Calypogeia fissa]